MDVRIPGSRLCHLPVRYRECQKPPSFLETLCMPRLGKLFKPACVQVYLPLLACKMFVPEELLFNTFLSYRGTGSFSDRSAAFQTQMGFIEVSTALTSLMFYGRAPAMCLLLAGCPSTAP